MNIIEYIRKKQEQLVVLDGVELPPHAPEMLLIGCVDARLDIIDDIGIPKGKALIMRNIAALVAGQHDGGAERFTEVATLEFAVDVMKVRHIVVMGHTDCGGIRACVEELDMPNIKRYLEPLKAVRRQIEERGGNSKHQAQEMEQAAIRLSLKNLRSYETIAKAEKKKEIMLHGWLIDTATHGLSVLDEASGTFNLMVEK